MRYLLLVISTLGLAFFSTASHAQESALPLVHVYCAEVSHLAKEGEPLSDDAWASLVTHLEMRELRPSEVGAKGLDDCLRENTDTFERAEFVLHGAKLLEASLKGFDAPTIHANSAPKVETASIGVPGLESLVLPSVEPTPSTAEEGRHEAEERRHHYSELWQDFLSDLRRKLSASFAPPRVTANIKR